MKSVLTAISKIYICIKVTDEFQKKKKIMEEGLSESYI